MARIILNKNEAALWLAKKNSPIYKQWRRKVAETINLLAGHLGGNGIELVDEDGNDLSDPSSASTRFSCI